jgi:hypothetical protein
MKKAFDQNVSRARPRVRLGSAPVEANEPALQVEAMAQAIANEPAPVIPDLASAVRARAAESREPKASAVQQVREKLAAAPVEARAVPEPLASPIAAPASDAMPTPYAGLDAPREPEKMAPLPAAAFKAEPVVEVKPKLEVAKARYVEPNVEAPKARFEEPKMIVEAPKKTTRAAVEPPRELVEVQSPRPPMFEDLTPPDTRRERLKERLKMVRENPRPEPLPETVAEAGVLAVERISALQTEVTKVRAINLALSQDLEAQRRQSERATEEARLRMDEARRLSSEMDTRAKLLADLERELAALEGERNESLLALQEARAAIDAGESDKDALRKEIQKRDEALAESLSEEERLASELESAHEGASLLRRSVDALRQERDTLARQVSDLTRERAELLEARKALEAVHRALSQAAAR